LDAWWTNVVDDLVTRGTDLISGLPLFQVIQFILALFGVRVDL